MEVISEAMKSVCNAYGANLHDFKELYEAVTGEELAQLFHFLLCKPSDDVKRQGELKNTRNDIFGPNDMNDSCDLAKTFIEPHDSGYAFCSALPSFLRW